MQNRILKVIAIIFLFICLINIFSKKSFADDGTNYDWVAGAKNFEAAANENKVGINKDILKNASDDIFNMFSSIGMIISVIVGTVLGIIYMMSSAVDKAKVKESLIPYLIGSFVIFGAFGIWKLVINTFNGI